MAQASIFELDGWRGCELTIADDRKSDAAEVAAGAPGGTAPAGAACPQTQTQSRGAPGGAWAAGPGAARGDRRGRQGSRIEC